jgi:hypothetical protein
MTTLPLPAFSSSDPESDSFRSLLVNNTSGQINMTISLPAQTRTLFYINNSTFTPGKPSVTLSLGSKEGPILGVLKLGVFSENTVGLGNPNRDEMEYERLKRVSNWTHGTYEFDYGNRGDRKTYTWQRTRQPIFGDQPDMELRENLETGGMGEVLAIYKGSQGFFTKQRGAFFIRKGMTRESGVEKKLEDWSNWELMILLTGCGIIEGARRRARARRHGGGGG